MIPIAKPYLTEDEAQSAHDTVLSGWVMQGPKVEQFENLFCQYTGAKYAVAVSNCTSALHLAMIVSGIGEKDEVICPSLSFIATANSIRFVGAKPVFAEINPRTYNIDPVHAESLINENTRAILIAHQIGMPADIDRFKIMSEKYDLKLIEDAACATGSRYKGKKIGSHSGMVCFSFHPRKVITTGEGGMITTDREDYYLKLRSLRHHGRSESIKDKHLTKKVIQEKHEYLGYNYRMTDIQAAIGIKQLEKLDWIVEKRREIAKRYIEELKDIKNIYLPEEESGCYSNYQSFMICLGEDCRISRDELIQKLFDAGISCSAGVASSHREISYREESGNLSLPASEKISDNGFIIPLYVPMDESDISHIISQLRKILG